MQKNMENVVFIFAKKHQEKKTDETVKVNVKSLWLPYFIVFLLQFDGKITLTVYINIKQWKHNSNIYVN